MVLVESQKRVRLAFLALQSVQYCARIRESISHNYCRLEICASTLFESFWRSSRNLINLVVAVMSQQTSRYVQGIGMLEPVPCTIDRIAMQTPGKAFISIPLDDNDVQKGYRDLSFGVFARAVNRCSWWLLQELGQSQSFETLSYSGPQDVRYHILLLASIKTGHNVGSFIEDRAVNASGANKIISSCFVIRKS